MLVQRKVPQQTETVEIKLPYFSKDGSTYYMITEKEDVFRVFLGGISSSLTVTKKFELGESCVLQDALEASPCTGAEVSAACEKAVSFMDETMSAFKMLK